MFKAAIRLAGMPRLNIPPSVLISLLCNFAKVYAVSNVTHITARIARKAAYVTSLPMFLDATIRRSINQTLSESRHAEVIYVLAKYTVLLDFGVQCEGILIVSG